MDLMHGAGGVCHRCHLVGIIFLPPVHGRSDIHRYKDLADIFAVITSGAAQALGQSQIIWSQHVIAVLIIKAVHPVPAVHRIACPAHGIFQIHDAGTF